MKFLQKEKALLMFAMYYNYVLVSCSIPLLMLLVRCISKIDDIVPDGMGLIEWIQNIIHLKDSITSTIIIGLGVCVVMYIMIFACFAYANIGFLKKYTSRHFRIKRSGNTWNDIKFIATFALICTILNIIIQLSMVGDALYRLLSVYLVQTPVLYIMLRNEYYNYEVTPRTSILVG